MELTLNPSYSSTSNISHDFTNQHLQPVALAKKNKFKFKNFMNVG